MDFSWDRDPCIWTPSERCLKGADGCRAALQDPVLFTGSIRSNVDPLEQGGGDDKVWQALEQAGLGSTVRGLEVRPTSACLQPANACHGGLANVLQSTCQRVRLGRATGVP